ncbi:MAG: hypothetical protein LJE68_02295 [Rhodobacter sp.]|nr:hypothetical protein [Rhodobacter sp.]
MKILRIAVVLIVLIALGGGLYVYQFGGLRTKREIAAFAEKLTGCTAFDQDFREPIAGGIMNRAILGNVDGRCGVRFDTFGPQKLVCNFDIAEMPKVADAFAGQSANIGIFGGYSIHVSTSDPDPLTEFMNGPDCAVSDG